MYGVRTTFCRHFLQDSSRRAGGSLTVAGATIEGLESIVISAALPSSAKRMKIAPQTFFNFCAAHVPLLQALAEQAGEVSDKENGKI